MPMVILKTTPRRLRRARARFAALVLFALQVAVAGSAIWEPRAQVRLGAHAEEQGTRHVGQHNEATCALCSARTQDAVPSGPMDEVRPPIRTFTVAAQQHWTHAVPRRSSTPSRAPPSRPA